MSASAEGLRSAAVAGGLLPHDAVLPAASERPWPVVLLTAFGAWLSALPLIGLVGALLGDLLARGVGPYVVAALVLTGALTVLRSRDVPLFTEQLAVPALLVGLGTGAWALHRDLGDRSAAGVMLLACLAAGLLVRGAWLRALLGAAAAGWLAAGVVDGHWDLARAAGLGDAWWAGHLALAGWGAAHTLLRPRLAAAARWRLLVALEPMLAGWLLATLAGLAAWAGVSFLVAGHGAGIVGGLVQLLAGGPRAGWTSATPALVSAGLAALASLVAARRWPSLRHPALAGAAAVGVSLAACMPTLGAVMLAGAACAVDSRPRLATAALVAAAWIVGAFYYALGWPLAHKALVLVAAAAVLAALARACQPPDRIRARDAAPAPRSRRAALLLALAAVLAVANGAIWQKERLIERGRPLFVELTPVDPRSLMQGDYMRLAYALPPGLPAPGTVTPPRLWARPDARGVAALRPGDGTAAMAGEIPLRLTARQGRWVVASDAWFFREGEAARWAPARYAEFRVEADGRALLVGLRGVDLAPL